MIHETTYADLLRRLTYTGSPTLPDLGGPTKSFRKAGLARALPEENPAQNVYNALYITRYICDAQYTMSYDLKVLIGLHKV